MFLNFNTLHNLSQNYTVLYVEDNLELLESTSNIFDTLFKHVDSVSSGDAALIKYNQHYQIHQKYHDIVISDIEMENLNGISLAKKMLALNSEQKIVIISAYDDKKYLLELIKIGIDAFMQKPINQNNMLEILYQICQKLSNNELIYLNDSFAYNIKQNRLTKNDNLIELGDNENKILHLFIKNKNQYFTTIEIFNHLFYNEIEKEFSEDSIKGIIKRLRKKLPPKIITNIRQTGYCIHL